MVNQAFLTAHLLVCTSHFSVFFLENWDAEIKAGGEPYGEEG